MNAGDCAIAREGRTRHLAGHIPDFTYVVVGLISDGEIGIRSVSRLELCIDDLDNRRIEGETDVGAGQINDVIHED